MFELSNDTLLKILKLRGHGEPDLKAGTHTFFRLRKVHIWDFKCKFSEGGRIAFLAAKHLKEGSALIFDKCWA